GDCGSATLRNDACDHRRLPREARGPKTGKEQPLLTGDREHEEAVVRAGRSRKHWCRFRRWCGWKITPSVDDIENVARQLGRSDLLRAERFIEDGSIQSNDARRQRELRAQPCLDAKN